MPHRSLFAIFTVALLMATLAAGDVYAQREGGRRGPGGPGGFGGGFGGFRGGSPLVGLLRIEEVRSELKVTEDQQELINILSDELREGRPEITGNFREMSEAEQAEFREKMEKWSAEQTAQAKETLKTILEEQQYTRLEQIQLQTRGVNALVDDEVAQALKLTPEQLAKLKETQEENGEAMREAMRGAFGGGRDEADREARRERMETFRKESEAKMLAHLTAEQQTQFASMKGEPFEMPRGALFGGGRPGGRDGGDGEGRRRGGRPGGDGGGNRPARPE
jgi:hypothetical protein